MLYKLWAQSMARAAHEGHWGRAFDSPRTCRGGSCRQDAVPTVGLLIYRYIVGKTAKKVQFPFDPAKDFLRWCQDLQIA